MAKKIILFEVVVCGCSELGAGDGNEGDGGGLEGSGASNHVVLLVVTCSGRVAFSPLRGNILFVSTLANIARFEDSCRNSFSSALLFGTLNFSDSGT